ncbi:MAG: hypothetical protein HYY24_24285 [Verrucomicrobia bacterium]|nr:hypothetical protein [Verrucomicrobiota bacterium]
MKLLNLLAVTIALFGVGLVRTQAVIVVNVGDYDLLPDTLGQVITINVSGVSGLAGLDFFIQVGDGFPDGGGTVDGPNVTNVDIQTGTLFDGNTPGQSALLGGPQARARFITTGTGTVSGSGLLATATLDTTGFTALQTWDLKLTGTINGDTTFNNDLGDPLAATIVNGSITVVPEPAAGVVVASLLLAGGWLLRRKPCA